MADVVGEKVESPPGGNDDAASPASPSPSTRGDGSEQATRPRHMPSDDAWAVAFKLNVAITFISVRTTPVSRQYQNAHLPGTAADVAGCVCVFFTLNRCILQYVQQHGHAASHKPTSQATKPSRSFLVLVAIYRYGVIT